jgi:hypothetical protein
MSETSTGLLEASTAEVDTAPTGTDRKRLLLLVGGAVAVAVVGFLAWLLLAGGSPEEEAVVAAPKPAAAAPAAPDAPADAEQVPESFEGDLGRDPFAPIFEPEAPEPEAVVGVPGAPVSDGSTGAVPGAAGTPVSVTVVEVTADGASLSVDGQAFEAKTDGSTFAEVFRLYSTFDDRCAGLLFGDQSVVLCEGDTRTLST